MAFHPAYEKLHVSRAPCFLKDHILTVMKENMGFQNDGADVLSCEYQACTNLKGSSGAIRKIS
jgi:hypothetical protein